MVNLEECVLLMNFYNFLRLNLKCKIIFDEFDENNRLDFQNADLPNSCHIANDINLYCKKEVSLLTCTFFTM